MNGEKYTTGEGGSRAEKTPEEKLISWEQTFSDIFYSDRGKDSFEGGLEAFISNVQHYANPERPGTNEGDIEFYQRILKLERILNICKEGHSWDRVKFLFEDISFEDQELKQKIEYFFSKYYSVKEQ